jgi:hypothetical protein
VYSVEIVVRLGPGPLLLLKQAVLQALPVNSFAQQYICMLNWWTVAARRAVHDQMSALASAQIGS